MCACVVQDVPSAEAGVLQVPNALPAGSQWVLSVVVTNAFGHTAETSHSFAVANAAVPVHAVSCALRLLVDAVF